jgi:hypothetical protein
MPAGVSRTGGLVRRRDYGIRQRNHMRRTREVRKSYAPPLPILPITNPSPPAPTHYDPVMRFLNGSCCSSPSPCPLRFSRR